MASISSSSFHTATSTGSTGNNLGLTIPDPATKQQRRISSSLPPPAPLNLPEPASPQRQNLRPPSPLRNGFTFSSGDDDESEDGSNGGDEDDEHWSKRSHSPSPSMAKLATNIAQKVGSLMGGVSPRPGPATLPTDLELEAEAEREREWSRREAERIIRQEKEAQERMLVEERVMALLQSSKSSPTNLPPPRPRSQTLPNPPSPSTSQKETKEGGGGWFTAVKNKLTPTKEPLTPAQQIIHETKQREKERRKSKDREWPASVDGKFHDPAFLNLASSAGSTPVTPPRQVGGRASLDQSPLSAAARGNSQSQTPQSAVRPISQVQVPIDFSPSYMKSVDSPSREAPPLYAQFNTQGALDVHATLLTIAKRFEKLERWTVGHVRALEERMSDVEKWLVDKENEKEQEMAQKQAEEDKPESPESPSKGSVAIEEIRDELVELSSRVTELGREMAKFAVSPPNLASGPTHSVVSATTIPVSVPARSLPTIPTTLPPMAPAVPTYTQIRQPDVTTPSRTASVVSNTSRTRLPYPTGDYTSPPGSVGIQQQVMSPANSPPSAQAARQRPVSIAGLPPPSSNYSMGSISSTSSSAGLPKSESPLERAASPLMKSNVTASKESLRPTRKSMSPTPRKRYTVALGEPITSPPDDDDESYSRKSLFSASPVSTPSVSTMEIESDANSDDEEGTYGHSREETIGKSAARVAKVALAPKQTPSNSPSSKIRIRAQSSYGPPSGYNALSLSNSLSPSPITPLKPRLRSRSTERFGLGINMLGDKPEPPTPSSAVFDSKKFVDPLIVRKQESHLKTPKARNPGKMPVGELVAFFDAEKRR